MEFDKQRLDILLLSLLGSTRLLDKWWNSPNKEFKHITPLEAYSANPKEVINYILLQFSY